MTYSIRKGIDPNTARPVIEVLHDGQDWGEAHPHDEHFRFGPFKAHMITAAKSVIQEFLESEGERPPRGQAVVATDETCYPSFSVTCCNYNHFIRHGHHIDQPYLKLRLSRFNIGFGLSKAEALVVLMNQIEAFVREHDA
jgi:hypothetical protein